MKVKTKYNVPITLIQKAVDENQLDTLYYALVLSHTSPNRVIKNFTHRKSASILKVSVATSHKQINRIIKLGLAVMQPNGNLKFNGVNKLKGKLHERTIQVPILDSKKKQVAAFRYSLIHKNLNLQKSQIDYKNLIVKRCSSPKRLRKKAIKAIAKAGGVKKLKSSINNKVTLSNKTFGEMLNRSASSGKRYQKHFNELKFISSSPNYIKLCDGKEESLNLVKKYYDCFFITHYKGAFYRRTSNEIDILHQVVVKKVNMAINQ